VVIKNGFGIIFNNSINIYYKNAAAQQQQLA
jgi:hypothetical protein